MARLVLTIEVSDPDTGDDVEHTIPAKFEICRRCEGVGHHTNPAIDGHGITADEWNGPDWDDESKETYLSGGYDVPCEDGCAEGKVLVPDLTHAGPDVVAVVERWQEETSAAARSRAEDRRTQRMESGQW
jgi:hypothetical protein